jgi:TorA maturation chaperone TorD
MMKMIDIETLEDIPVAVLAEIARQRANIYHILSVTYSRPVNEALLKVFRSWSTLEAELPAGSLPEMMKFGLKKAASWLGDVDSQPSSNCLTALELEFVRLFRGVRREFSPPPPYESVYVDSGFLYGQSTEKVNRKYQQYYLKGRNNEPPDHVAIELDFMRFLCEREAEDWQSSGEASRLLEEQYGFLREHLVMWVPALCANIRESCETDFYSGVADLTEGWIYCDQEIIKGVIDMGKRDRQPENARRHT